MSDIASRGRDNKIVFTVMFSFSDVEICSEQADCSFSKRVAKPNKASSEFLDMKTVGSVLPQRKRKFGLWMKKANKPMIAGCKGNLTSR
jgi:hypothetical protein